MISKYNFIVFKQTQHNTKPQPNPPNTQNNQPLATAPFLFSLITPSKLATCVITEKFAFFDLKRAYHSQFSKVNLRQSPQYRRIRKKTL